MKSEIKDDSRRRLAKISGQVSGIQKMIEKERPCSEILQQIAAASVALDRLKITFLSEHLQTCVLHQNVHDEASECCTFLPEEKRAESIRTTLRQFLK